MTEKDIKDVVAEFLSDLDQACRWLQRSYDKCCEADFCSLSDDDFDNFEALTGRYARVADMSIQKGLRALDEIEMAPRGSLLDAANRAVKRGLIDEVGTLREWKDTRNDIAHEYACDDLVALFRDVLEYTPQLLEFVERIKLYAQRFA